MDFWKQLFGKRQPESRQPEGQTGRAGLGTHLPTCPFCRSQDPPAESIGLYGHPLWRCRCGSIGSGAWTPDLDEVADQLLQILGIDETVSEPVMPTDHPLISLQGYDANKAERDFRLLLRDRGYQLRTAKLENSVHGIAVFWVSSRC